MSQTQTKTSTKVNTAVAVAMLGAASLAAAGVIYFNAKKVSTLEHRNDYTNNVQGKEVVFTKVTPAILASVAEEYRINTDGITSIRELLSAIDDGGVVFTRPSASERSSCCKRSNNQMLAVDNDIPGSSYSCMRDCQNNADGHVHYYKGKDGTKMWVEYDKNGDSVNIGSIT